MYRYSYGCFKENNMPSHSSDHLSLVIVNRILFLSACECQAFRDSVKGTKILRYAFLGTGIHYIVQQLCCKLTCAQCQLKKLRSTRGSMQVLPVHTCKLSPAACVTKKKKKKMRRRLVTFLLMCSAHYKSSQTNCQRVNKDATSDVFICSRWNN